MNTPSLPYRFSLTSFNRFAPTIAAALRAFPNAIAVRFPDGIPSSFAQPLRDAITAKLRYGHEHPAVDNAPFAMYAESLVVAQRDDHLLVGPASAIKAGAVQPTPATIEGVGTALPDEVVVTPTLQALHAVAILVSQRALNPLPNFVVIDAPASLVASLPDRYDIAFVPVEGTENKHQII